MANTAMHRDWQYLRLMRASLPQDFFGCGDYVFHFKTKFLEQILERSGGSKRAHPDDFALGASVAVPAENGLHFHGDARGNAIRSRLGPLRWPQGQNHRDALV